MNNLNHTHSQDRPTEAGQAEGRTGPEAGTPTSLKSVALRGSVWTIGGYVSSQILRLAGNLILARLLFPAVFGQMALVNIFMQGLQMFSDVGIGPAIVQNPKGDDERFLNTAWTIQAGRGVVLWLASCAIAAPVATFYAQPVLRLLLPVVGLNAVVSGFEATAVHWVQKHLRLARLTLLELSGQAVGIIVIVLLAILDRSIHGANNPGVVWAVAAGGLANSATRLLLSHTVLPGIRNRFCVDRALARELLAFGRWIFVSTLLTFLAGQADRLVFGKMIPIGIFGVYSIAAMIALLPTQGVGKLGGLVIFPAYSRLVGRVDFQQLFWRVRWPITLVGAATVSALIACGPFLIRVLYDSRYASAGWILQYLAAAAWFQILESTVGAALLAQGHVRWVAAGNAAKVVGMVGFVPLGFHFGGFPGALVGLVLADALKYLTAVAGAGLYGLRGFSGDLLATVATAGVAYLGVLGANALQSRYPTNLAAAMGAAVVVGTAWAIVGAVFLWRTREGRRLPPGVSLRF